MVNILLPNNRDIKVGYITYTVGRSGFATHFKYNENFNNLLRLGESIGDVMEETRKALDDDKIDEKEKEQISIEVIELEKKIAELKLKLNLGEKTDYKNQKKREL